MPGPLSEKPPVEAVPRAQAENTVPMPDETTFATPQSREAWFKIARDTTRKGVLLDPEATAKLLDITVERLLIWRQSKEIAGLRDGASWKFKSSEVARAHDETPSLAFDDEPLDLRHDSSEERLDLPADDADDLILGGSDNDD